MKKLFVVLFIVISVVLLAELTETKTISSTSFSDLKDACADSLTGGNGTDEVMTFYYNKLKQTRDEGDGDDWRESRASFEPINQVGYYAKLSMLGAIGRGLENSYTWENNLIRARRFLLDSTFVDYDHPDPNMHNVNMYLSLDSLWVEYEEGTGSDCLSLGTTLINLCFITDMLWHYADSLELYNKLDEIAYYAYLILDEDYSYTVFPDTSLFNGVNYPVSLGIAYTNGRIRLAGALAYAGCILENAVYINTAEHDIFYEECTTVAETRYGYLDLMTAENGTYCEGMLYTQFTLEGLTPFFTARNRLDLSHLPELNYGANVNWYEEDKVKNLYINSMDLIGPDFGYLEIDDAVKAGIKRPSGELVPPMTFTQLLTYYYQGTSLEHKANINWFFDAYHDFHNIYPAGLSHFGKIPQLFSYSDINDPGNSVPQNIVNGSLSDSEFTIFRKATSNNYEIYNSPTLIVTHDKSNNYSSHEHSDQGGFMLYYKGKPLLIDPGYRPTWDSNIGREWLKSPFAHNVIMVNPYRTDENHNETFELNHDYRDLAGDWEVWTGDVAYPFVDFHLTDFEPIGWYNEGFVGKQKTNPAFKQYFIANHKLQHLKVKIDYDHPQLNNGYNGNYDDIIEVNRNYYSIDIEDSNPCFIIYDDLTSLLHNSENEFVNQLHFALYPADYNTYYSGNDFLTEESTINSEDGEFEYHNYENSSKLYGAMGAINNSTEWDVADSLPQGLYCGSNWDASFLPPQWEHKALRINTTTEGNEIFLTLLIPSEDSDNPIDYVVNSTDGYGVKYKINPSDTYDTYAAVYSGDTHFRFLDDLMQFNTSSDFFLIETNNVCSDIKKLVLNGDNKFEIHDLSGTRFDDVLVFDSDYDFEEMIATYELDCLNVVFKTEWNDHPKYKILRYGVEPQNFSASSYFDTYLSGTQPDPRYYFEHIQSLAYDENYFYVNYAYSDLSNENLLTSGLTIHQGVFDGITIQGVTQFGSGDIVLKNEIPVPFGTEIVFLTGAQPKLDSNFHLVVEGNLTALGTAENNIIFDKYSSTNWNKIEITNAGNANMRYCKLHNAQFPLNNRGYIEIENCEFLDNISGIILDNPIGYLIKYSTINNSGYGILLRNTHRPMYRSAIKNNLITNNNYGLWFYNASAYVEEDTIFANRYAGIMGNRGSNPVIVSSSISSTYYNSTDYPEIKISGSSYPITDRNGNDIIFGDGHSIYNMDTTPREYYCREVWWGTTDELAISNSFYPLSWPIDFIPISQSPNVGYNPWSGGSLFKEGLLAESNGDFDTAKTKYTQSIEENPDEIEALWSASRLLNCSETETEYVILKEYYGQLQVNYTETDLAKAAKLDEIFCNRLLGNHQDAITEYEFLLDENLTFIDSVFTQLDIVYTYMEASSGGNRGASVTFRNSENALSSVKQAEEREVELWSLLENQITAGGIYSPEISNSILHKNYPNPFNPSTTISFSIPKESKVEITIYNIRGQKVRTVLKDNMGKGIYNTIWNGKDSSGKEVGSGVYFYKLNVDGKTCAIKKCLLLK